jgi:hypothetical protein
MYFVYYQYFKMKSELSRRIVHLNRLHLPRSLYDLPDNPDFYGTPQGCISSIEMV